MPPKRSRNRGASASSSATSKTVATQTDDTYFDLANYQKQIKLLQQQVEDDKKEIITLRSENNVLKNQSKNPIKICLVDKSEASSNRKVSSPGGIRNRGCTCKGSCSNKICGCVKKNLSCSEFCKCNQATCKNQDPDKENVEQSDLSKDGESVMEKLGVLNLNQEALHASEKKARKSIFSPFSAQRNINCEARVPSPSPITFVTKRRLFVQYSDEMIDIQNDIENKSETEEVKEQMEESYTYSSKTRSSAVVHSPPLQNNNHDRLLKVQSTHETAGTDEIPFIQKSKKVQHSPIQIRKKPVFDKSSDLNNTNCSNGNLNVKEVDETRKNESVTIRSTKVQHSPPKPIMAIFDTNSPNRNSNNYNLKIEAVNETGINNEIPFNCKSKKVLHSPVSNTTIVESNSSTDSSISNENAKENVADVSLHPMVPKRQLPRSPILTGASLIEIQEMKKFSPPKKELAMEEVDWEQHQSELVTCKKCKRKFFPHRIEKHMKSCKKI